ncbi:MAG: HlyD family efflux transporter periplasmic adaptor subunit [Firmicutes bacterium]|nr:HlyD family efflux transporter periplasmic adaptor subunit [Bacillota bacterium]
MKKKVALFLLLIAVASLAYWGHYQYNTPNNEPLAASGTIEATRVQLSAKVSGSIKTIDVVAGNTVKKGQVVAQIERNDLKAQKERDALTVMKAEAQLDDLKAGSRQQEIKQATANTDIARANFEKAQLDYQRIKKLYEQGAVPKSKLEQAETLLKTSEGQLSAVEAKLDLLKAGSRENAIEAARIELESRKAILKASQAILEDTKVISPINGTVASKNREQGEFVPAGASIATVVNLNDMWITVFIPTDELPSVKLGQKVTFTVSGSNKVYQGVIKEIASEGEFTPKTIQTKEERTNIVFEVKIAIDNNNGTLKPGMPADVIFNGDANDKS